GVAQVAHDQRQSRGQRQCHADDDEREHGGEGGARKPAQRTEHLLQRRRAVRGDGATHVWMSGRSESCGACAVMRAACPARKVSAVVSPPSSTISPSPHCFTRWGSCEAITTVTPTSWKRLNTRITSTLKPG